MDIIWKRNIRGGGSISYNLTSFSGVANTVVNAIDKEVMEPVLGTEILGSVLRIVPGTAYVMNMSPSSKKPKPGLSRKNYNQL